MLANAVIRIRYLTRTKTKPPRYRVQLQFNRAHRSYYLPFDYGTNVRNYISRANLIVRDGVQRLMSWATEVDQNLEVESTNKHTEPHLVETGPGEWLATVYVGPAQWVHNKPADVCVLLDSCEREEV